MFVEEPEGDSPLFCDGRYITMSRSDESLLGLLSPAPIDQVADRALEYVGRFTNESDRLRQKALAQLTAGSLSLQESFETLPVISGLARDINRSRVIFEFASLLSMHTWLGQEGYE